MPSFTAPSLGFPTLADLPVLAESSKEMGATGREIGANPPGAWQKDGCAARRRRQRFRQVTALFCQFCGASRSPPACPHGMGHVHANVCMRVASSSCTYKEFPYQRAFAIWKERTPVVRTAEEDRLF